MNQINATISHNQTALLKCKKANELDIDFVISTDQVQEAIQTHQNFYEAINSFEFNIFEFSDVVGRQMQMPFVATSLIQHNNL